MSNKSSKSQMVPEARGALNNMKYEIARELGVDYQQAYKGNLSARENGYVGGYMVKRLIEQAERGMSGKQN
ncbi:MAG: alpha/beta-type small acid-soluble spore protein [Clostridia bacterium]|nr:alpha/beta-type small acid-soluble spore protein [Clostridia bacterium]